MVLSIAILLAVKCEAEEAPLVVWAETLAEVSVAAEKVFSEKLAKLEKESDAELARYIDESIKKNSETKAKYAKSIKKKDIEALDAELAKNINTMTIAHKEGIDRYREKFNEYLIAINSLILAKINEEGEIANKCIEKTAKALKDGKGE